ncbi:restriction endonuclease subunit R [Ornithobacterium rhinotracheale]|uniref:helicase-related protein n=1 Tax=Ornithobacterium rhinotracheale TaxID=28251 RepID=UPI00129C2256|nr:toprim domain-containing protein [Ornithobacterium rhinotracheale]MRI64223.1 restriction endonuclease subunit R [Ornithobacterium rhinotracheale]
MKKYTPEEIQKITESVSVLDYFRHLENKGLLTFDRKTGHDHYFLTENNKFSVNDDGFYDFKTGEGGKIIKAVMQLENKSWKEAIDFLKDFSNTGITQNAEKRQGRDKNTSSATKPKINHILRPNNDKLLQYFEERGISSEVLQANTKQVHYAVNDKKYFGIGLKNDSGGYEIRNPFMKTKLGASNITTIKGEKNAMVVFEGMTDMLSFLQIVKDNKVENKRSLVVLNSVTNADKFIDKHKDYMGKIHLVLDGDKAGNETTAKILSEFSDKNIEDARYKYDIGGKNKDLNDYLKNKNGLIKEKNTNLAEINNQTKGNEATRIESKRLSTSESVGREETQRNDRELNTPSQSEQGGNLRERQTMDSNDAGDGLSPSERIDLGRGGRVGTTLLGTQQSRVKGTGIIHEEGYRGTGESVRGSESSQHDNNRGEQNQADNGGRFTRRGESGSPRQNVGERNGTRDEGVPQNQNTSSERLAILIQEIKNLPKPSNEQITEAVNLVASVSSNHQITLNENATLYEKELKGIISQYQSGGITKIKGEKGVLDEYYTDTKIVEAVRNLIQDNFKNQKNIKVLEPSVGIGNFINATKELPKSNITAFEINETTAKIAKILHPETTINLRSFETEFIDDKGRKKDFTPKYDLVIGNPPYGQHRGYYYGLGEESKISRYEDYFVKRSLDVLKEGGVLAMVLPSSYLNRQNKLNNAEMVEAFRLPNGVFKGTDVGTDILILKKNSQIQDNDISNYFNLEENQKRVLGEIGIKTNRYGREESYVKGDLESALQQIKELKKDSYKAEEARQLNLFEDFTEEQDTIKEQTNAEKEEQKQENTILDTAREKVNQAKDTLENIKFKSLAIQDEIENYFQLGHKLEDEPEQFTNENLEEIIKKAESVIKITKKKNDDYTLQTTPEIKKGILKYHFQKQDEIVEAGLQNNSNISQKQLKAFQDTYYDGSIEYKEENKEFASFENGVWKNNFYYAEGNIYEKLDQLELDKTLISEKQYNKQKQLLESVLPKPKSLEEIIISPNHEFVHKLHLRNEEKEFYSPLRASYYKEMVNISMADDFKEFLRKLPSEAFGSSSSWEVSGFVNNENVTGNDRERNALVRERRKEVANDLFNKYLREEISDEVKELFVSEFNRKHNNIYVPDYSQFPMFSKINKNFKGKPLELTEVQKAGIGRQTTKGVGLLAHEVGFGKTLSGILAMHEAMERGYATRPLIVVPNNNILKQWVETIFEAIPEAKVNVLGNLGKDYDLSKFNNRDGEITIVTYEGFNNIGFSEDITKRLASQFEYISSQEMKSLQNSSARDVAKEREKEREIEGKMKKGKVYDWEDFGFDHLTFDEVHNANHIVGKVKIESRSFASDFRSQNQRTSKLGINTWMAAQYIQEQNNGRNITLLSATPFTNKPLEYYSILSLIANDRLEEAGFLNVNNFFETFMEADNDIEINAKGDVQFKTNVRRFKNNALFQQLLSEFIDIKGEEDNPELIRPNRINKEYKIEQNQLTEEQFEELNNQYDETKDGAILTHILNARLTAISPYLSPYYEGDKPTNKEFIENSPKLDATMKLIAQNKKDKPEAGQIIYSEIAVDEFPRFKKYLVDEVGYKDKEVAIISGGTSKSQREKIQEDFNEGKIKVIIGSSAIQEGMNLQENTTDMYLLSLPYNFTSLRQTEGRMWRQGNKWENVRVNYMLTNDSIDVFMLQTLQNKQQRYLEAMKKGADVVDVSDIDTQALKTAIITNPETRANIEIELMRKKLEKEKERYEADNAFSLRKFEKYTKAKEAENKALGQVNLYKRYLENNSSENSYWKGVLGREEKNYQDRVKDTEKVIESMAKQGVDVVSFQEKIKANEEKVAEVDDKIMDLENFEKELIQKYTKEKQRLLQEKSQINIAEERAEENKTFFKLAPIKEELAERKTEQENAQKSRMKR